MFHFLILKKELYFLSFENCFFLFKYLLFSTITFSFSVVMYLRLENLDIFHKEVSKKINRYRMHTKMATSAVRS